MRHCFYHTDLGQQNAVFHNIAIQIAIQDEDNFKKTLDLDGSTPEPAIQSSDTGQRIPCFDSCQWVTTLTCISFPVLRSQTS